MHGLHAPTSGLCSFQTTSRCEVSADELGAWHFRSGALLRLTPPWMRVHIEREAIPLENGACTDVTLRCGLYARRWSSRHSEVVYPREFTDTLERGPFASWRHTHRFLPTDDGASTLEDTIRFDPKGGAVARVLLEPLMQRTFRRIFAFRHARVHEDLRRHSELNARFGERSLRIGVTGAHGCVGTQLCAFLSTAGHSVVRFVRSAPSRADERQWDPTNVESGVDVESIADLDVIIHLAGASIAAGRWNPARKKQILESRTQGTMAMSRAIAKAPRKPEAFLCASAIGFYGHRGDEWVSEQSARGEGFLADVASAWEDATRSASNAGVRTAHMRFGVILTASGGALAQMTPAFRAGLGGRVGAGTQGLSWISLDDAIAAVLFIARNESIRGPVNCVAPSALTQRGFASVLGRVLARPSIVPLPAVVVRALLGELGQALLLEGAFVRPTVLEREGFRFAHPSLEDALRFELGRVR